MNENVCSVLIFLLFLFRTKIDMAMPFKKESPFLPSIQKALTELRQNGVIEKVDSDYKQSLKLKEHINCDAGVTF